MDYEIDNDKKCEIFTYLKSIGCCMQCCLRVTGITKDYYVKFMPDANEQCTADSMGLFDENKSCVTCLGILQNDVQKTVVDKITETLISSEYDATQFSCNLIVPMSLVLREKSVDMTLAKNITLSDHQWDHLKLRRNSIKEAWKLKFLPDIEDKTLKHYVVMPHSSILTMDVSFLYDNDENECRKLIDTFDYNNRPKCNKNFKVIFSKNKIEKILANITDNQFMGCFPVPPVRSPSVVLHKVNFCHGSIFIGGRYAKLSRQLCQTPWFINGEKKMESSVQDLLSDIIVNYTKADSIKFLSSGREDVDVRTINLGRPFAIELVNPKITQTLDDKLKVMVNEINASTKLIKITTEMRVLSLLDLKTLKEGENAKTKFYRALCVIKNECNLSELHLDKLTDIKNLKIIQNTPMRVLHRRPLTPRTRVIHEMRARWLTSEEQRKMNQRYEHGNFDITLLSKLFILDVKTQAGTYIKEFVHGDFGRTHPNLCYLLSAEIDIVALDVTGINIHWP